MGDSASTRQTPLHAEHVALGAKMTPFAGWDMPLSYPDGQVAEHNAVRQRAGIFDVSHMGQVRFTGAGTIDFLAWLTPGNVRRLEDGGSLYTMLCNESGGVLDDFIVTRLSETEWFAVINAATAPHDIAWMREKAKEFGYGGEIRDECDAWAMIALQGPDALAMAERIFPGRGIAKAPAFTMHTTEWQGTKALVSRTGYTGEDGVEVLVSPEAAPAVWQFMLAEGAVPCGLAARDSLRLEMGYPLYGNDLDEESTPLECGVGWTVSLKKEDDFIGRGVLEKMKAEGAPRLRIGLRAEGRRPLHKGDVVTSGGHEVGKVTSGGYSPVLGVGIGLAIVEADSAKEEMYEIVRGGRSFTVTKAKPPFVTPGSKS